MNNTKHLISELENLELVDLPLELAKQYDLNDAFKSGQLSTLVRVKQIISKHLHHNDPIELQKDEP